MHYKCSLFIVSDRTLTAGLRYHFYVRAWYSDTSYAVFRSDGVTPDIEAPEISKVRGTKVSLTKEFSFFKYFCLLLMIHLYVFNDLDFDLEY